ncbi:MAG: hypothetical protein QW154_04095 [Sulfolobales archaeon]
MGQIIQSMRCIEGLHSLALLLLLAIIACGVSTYLHVPSSLAPFSNFGLKYSDIVFGVFYPRFSADYESSSKYWYNVEILKLLMERKVVCPVPYIDYSFEYPPLVGLLWYISTCFSITITLRSESTSPYASSYIHSIAELHFIVNAFFLSLSLLLSVFFLHRLVITSTKKPSFLSIATWLVLPSTILYSIYNWDVICLAFALSSLVALHRKKYFTSGALIGASIATKLMTASIAYTISLYLLLRSHRGEKLRNFSLFLLGISIFGATPYVTLLVVSPRGFFDFVAHHSAWYCENCIYLLFIHDIFSYLHRTLAIALVIILAITIALLIFNRKSIEDSSWLYKLSTLSTLGAVLFNYVFSPQMILLFSPLVMVFFVKISRIAYIASDTANSLIMVLFFYDSDIRYLLNRSGIPVEVRFSPWTIDSPVQWLAAIRNILLLLIFVVELVRLSRSKPL